MKIPIPTLLPNPFDPTNRLPKRWKRILQLPRKRRRHQTRQELRRIDKLWTPIWVRREYKVSDELREWHLSNIARRGRPAATRRQHG